MKILITGGAGFIGSHIADLCISNNHDVVIIDNLIHGKKNYINSKAKFYEMDIRDKSLQNVFEVEKPDIVIHQAAQISMPKSIEDPIYDADINVLGTLNILEACVKNNVEKIVYPSSAAIFGEPHYLPIDENHPLEMMSGYGVSKHTVEHYMKVYYEMHGLKYTVLRYANVFGPRQDSTGEGGVVSIFCEQMLLGNIPSIFGDGSQTRDFVYVEDVASANYLAAFSDAVSIYNVCTNTSVSVNGLFEKIKVLLNTDIKPIYKPERKGDIRHSYMSFDKIKKEIGWEPKIGFDEGLKRTLEYYGLLWA